MAIKIDDHIIFENDEFVAVNKPSGILTIPDREGVAGLRNLLQEKYGSIFTVHRLDRDTSGIVVFARTEAAHKHLSQQFEHRETSKIYNGLVLGSPFEKSGVINEPISEHPSKKGFMTVYKKGKESITEYEVLSSYRLYSWMQFRILTGRTHQIRVHMRHLGNPIVCDPLYGDGKPVFISGIKSKFNLAKEEEERPILSRLALHASQLQFKDLSGETVELTAPLSKDMKATLQQLNKQKK
ncbi:MAG: Pseudouridine synthase [Flaviaesturariibacter sp.]|nr:Pseudouridine synthase [Flaviaesturariibacter sp.]